MEKKWSWASVPLLLGIYQALGTLMILTLGRIMGIEHTGWVYLLLLFHPIYIIFSGPVSVLAILLTAVLLFLKKLPVRIGLFTIALLAGYNPFYLYLLSQQ
ncbi:hypothetical protein [Tumebacillus flagellatus]|uniref:Uncharacterized protein n=1 Tax=Tumebacillus flagellatus TaxID=1157490 RepID=A0A074LPY1_9BACL|nr:hypothetical protein [Tumebacillus flagellatus]KEO83129.1 hypothetical protein EL26_11715 [Tumebacillus flagellatus]